MLTTKRVVAIAAVVAFVSLCLRCSPGKGRIVGRYGIDMARGRGSLMLNLDGSLQEEISFRSGEKKLLKGSWNLSGGEVLRTPCFHLVDDEEFGQETTVCSQPLVADVWGGMSITIFEDVGLRYQKE